VGKTADYYRKTNQNIMQGGSGMRKRKTQLCVAYETSLGTGETHKQPKKNRANKKKKNKKNKTQQTKKQSQIPRRMQS